MDEDSEWNFSIKTPAHSFTIYDACDIFYIFSSYMSKKSRKLQQKSRQHLMIASEDIFFSDLNINVKNTYYDIQFALHYLSMTDVTSSN